MDSALESESFDGLGHLTASAIMRELDHAGVQFDESTAASHRTPRRQSLSEELRLARETPALILGAGGDADDNTDAVIKETKPHPPALRRLRKPHTKALDDHQQRDTGASNYK